MAKDYDDLLQLRTTIMRTIISAIFVMLALTAESYAAELPYPWELPPEQLGPLLRKQDPVNLNKGHFVQPDQYGDEIFCTSKSALFSWRRGTTHTRQRLNEHGKCFHAPVAWFEYGIGPHKGNSEISFINPSGTYLMELWTNIEFALD